MNQEITFLSDGDDTLRELQLEMSPKATHILDWFHLTMKLTVLDQYGKGLVQCEAVLGEEIREKIERLKWSLWHGQVDKALGKIDDLETSIGPSTRRMPVHAIGQGVVGVAHVYREQPALDPELRASDITTARRSRRVLWSRR